VDEEEVTTIVRTNLKGLCRQIFDHEFFVKHPSPDPDIYISFISIFSKICEDAKII
jgi:hypothetical protein